MDCWYKKTCNRLTENCTFDCIRYLEMKYLIESSQIPLGKQFNCQLIPQFIDIENFKFLNELKKDIENFIKSGENLYIFSERFGNGKTTWAIKFMKAYFNKIWAGNGFTQRGLFVHVPFLHLPINPFRSLCVPSGK